MGRGKGNLEAIHAVGLGTMDAGVPQISNDAFWIPKERSGSSGKLGTVFMNIQDFSLFSDEGIGSVLRLVNGPLTPALEIFIYLFLN